MMNKKKQAGDSTVALLGVKEITEDSLLTEDGQELVYFLTQPSNLAVLSEASVAARINALMHILKGTADLELLCLNSRADFEDNKAYYRSRIARETNPAIRRLLQQDLMYLDRIQVSMATAREFLIVLRLGKQGNIGERAFYLNRIEKNIQEQGFSVQRAGREEIKRLLAVYFQQNVVAGRLDDFDGERWVIQN